MSIRSTMDIMRFTPGLDPGIYSGPTNPRSAEGQLCEGNTGASVGESGLEDDADCDENPDEDDYQAPINGDNEESRRIELSRTRQSKRARTKKATVEKDRTGATRKTQDGKDDDKRKKRNAIPFNKVTEKTHATPEESAKRFLFQMTSLNAQTPLLEENMNRLLGPLDTPALPGDEHTVKGLLMKLNKLEQNALDLDFSIFKTLMEMALVVQLYVSVATSECMSADIAFSAGVKTIKRRLRLYMTWQGALSGRYRRSGVISKKGGSY